MKKIFTLLTAVALGSASFGQVFQSDLSSWQGGVPTDWMGTKSSIAPSDVVEQTIGATYGTSTASLVNATTSHKRFTTQAVTVVGGETYEIKMWVAASAGDLRTNYYDITNAQYGSYNPYLDMSVESAGNLVMVSQTVTMPATCTSAEFILSLRNTDAVQASAGLGILVDSVSIAVIAVSYTPKTISEIQTTTTDASPEVGNFIETSGVVTAVKGGNFGGYWIQDGNGAWSGVYVDDANNTPAMGDSVTVQGQVGENFGATQIENISTYTLNSAPMVIPTPTVLGTADINTMEDYEGVLVKGVDVECTSTDYGFGQWVINTDPNLASDSLRVDDDIFNFGGQVLGTHYEVTGIGHFSYGKRKILPRMASDVVEFVSIAENNLTFDIYPNPATNNVTISGINGNINIYAINGKVVYSGVVNGKSTINVADLTNGLYIVEVIENNVKANYKLIVE